VILLDPASNKPLASAPIRSLDPAVVNSPNYQPVSEKTQLGFLPIFYYKIDFRAGGKPR